MNNSDIRVVPGPASYFSCPGSLERLSDFFSADQFSRTAWAYGGRVLVGAESFPPMAFHLPEVERIRFTGHYSERDVAKLAQASGGDRAVVTGVGGGALFGSAKVLARRLGIPLVAIPTIAATCAARTSLSVWYSDAGQALNFKIFSDVNSLVLVEPRIILNAPAGYLLAGINDTLAKWYEIVVLASQPEALPLIVQSRINDALAIRDVPLTSSETALTDQCRDDLTQALRDAVEMIIAGGGMAGRLGERHARVAAAHAAHNELTMLPQTDEFLHDIKVVYGVLVRSALLTQDDVLAQLVRAYQRFNLPTTLAALEIDINDRTELDRVIAHTLRPGESVHYLPVTLTPGVLRATLEKVEYFSR